MTMATSQIPFVTGNPQIEMQSGTISVYGELKPIVSQGVAEFDFPGSIDQNDNACLVRDNKNALNSEHVLSHLLAFLCVPARFVPTDLISMLSPYHEDIQTVRLLRHYNDPRQFIALVSVISKEQASNILKAFEGKPFNTLESVTVMVAFAEDISFDEKNKSGPIKKDDARTQGGPQESTQALAITAQLGVLSMDSKAALMGTANSTRQMLMDKQNHDVEVLEDDVGMKRAGDVRRFDQEAQCVVCLDQMDKGGAVLTMACNHAFHLACLVRWEDSPCPVCRYHHNLGAVSSQCQYSDLATGVGCQHRNGLLVCVLCGFVGCGGRLGHGQAHYEDALHAYALEMDSQQVWDFAGDGYVHRLIMSKGDAMKLIEAPDPNSASSADDSDNYERRGLAHLSACAEEEATHRKLEGLAFQYNELLAGQLEAQRSHFESELAELRNTESTKGGPGLMSALTNEQRQMQQRLAALRRRTRRVADELKIVNACNEQIRDNILSWDQQLVVAEREGLDVKRATEKLIPDLESRVSELMMQLDLEKSAVPNHSQNETPDVQCLDPEEEAGGNEWTVEVAPVGGRKKKGKKKGK